MDVLLIGDYIKIFQENQLFKIEFKYAAYELINSLIKTCIITGASSDDKYKTISFTAYSIKTLDMYKTEETRGGRTHLTISEAAKMIQSLSIQLKYLIEEEESMILGYNPDYIIIINDDTYVYLGSELISKLDSDCNEMTSINCPFDPSDFLFSPEMLKINKIPSYIHFKSSYFSLALLIITLITEDDYLYKTYITQHNSNNPNNILDALKHHPIKNTKIYWLLSRCLEEDINKRCMLLI